MVAIDNDGSPLPPLSPRYGAALRRRIIKKFDPEHFPRDFGGGTGA